MNKTRTLTCGATDRLTDRLKTARTRAQLRQGKTDWYRIRNATGDDGPAEVYIYNEIGWFGVTAEDFIHDLKQITASEVTLRLSSPGGDVFDGIAIYGALRSHPARVTVQVDSLAASIASVIAMAGDRIVVLPHSEVMIHEAAGLCIGDAADMREMAELLDRQSNKIAGIYAERAGGRVDSWRKKMKAESWYFAQEAVDAGLADEIAKMPPRRMEPMEPDEDEPDMAAEWDLSIFRYPSRAKAPAPPLTDTAPADTAVGPHDTAAKEGTWDKGAEEGRLPSPVPLATARRFYAWYDSGRVENGKIPKDAGKLPHHFVSEDGTPGAASINGVNAALSRLSQTEGLTDEERDTVERHLRGHLPADEEENRVPAPTGDPDRQSAPGPSHARLRDGETLADYLTRRIADLADDEAAKVGLLARMADEAGTPETAVGQALAGKAIPPVHHLEGFARALDAPVDSVIRAAERDERARNATVPEADPAKPEDAVPQPAPEPEPLAFDFDPTTFREAMRGALRP